MRVLVASDDSGSLKEIVFNKGTNTSVQTALQPFHLDMHLSQGLGNRVDKMWQVGKLGYVVARHSGSLELISGKRVAKAVDESVSPKYDVSEFEVKDIISGLFKQEVLDKLSSKSKKRTKIEDQFVDLYALPNKKNTLLAATKSGQIIVFKVDVKAWKLSVLAKHEVKAPVEFLVLNDLLEDKEKYTLAYGGEENLVKLIEMSSDLKTVSQVWAAKNVPFDKIGLRVPAWDMALRFIASEKEGVFQMLTVTKYAQYRKYSTDAEDCRPIQSVDLLPKGEQLAYCKILGKTSALENSVCSNFDDIELLTADSRRDVYQFNGKGRLLRKIGKGDITGFASCVTVTDKYILQGGLDRYFRVFDLSDYKLLAKIFTGGKISDILLLEEEDLELPLSEKELKQKKKKLAKRKFTEDEEEAENEELWKKLTAKKKKSEK